MNPWWSLYFPWCILDLCRKSQKRILLGHPSSSTCQLGNQPQNRGKITQQFLISEVNWKLPGQLCSFFIVVFNQLSHQKWSTNMGMGQNLWLSYNWGNKHPWIPTIHKGTRVPKWSCMHHPVASLRPFIHGFGIGHEAVLEDNGHGSTHKLLTNHPPIGFI